MKYLGIDYGSKRIGLSVSDSEGKIAFPRTVIPNDNQALARIVDVVSQEKVAGIVVGDTKGSSGAQNPVTESMEKFAEALSKETSIAVERVWEMWSSIEASRFAPKGREHDDAAAAAIILQRFLDAKQGTGSIE